MGELEKEHTKCGCVYVIANPYKPHIWSSMQQFLHSVDDSMHGCSLHVGVSNEGRSCSIAIGPLKECKLVGNKACAMPWCHGVGNFEVKTSRF